MDRFKRLELKKANRYADFFSSLDAYLKATITEEMERVFDKEVCLLDPEHPWVFQTIEQR